MSSLFQRQNISTTSSSTTSTQQQNYQQQHQQHQQRQPNSDNFFHAEDRPFLTLLATSMRSALKTTTGSTIVQQLLNQNPDPEARYPEVKLAVMMLRLKKLLASSSSSSSQQQNHHHNHNHNQSSSSSHNWRDIMDHLDVVYTFLPDPVFRNLVEGMKKHNRDSANGMKVEVATVKVADYIIEQVLDGTDNFSKRSSTANNGRGFRFAFLPEPPFTPVPLEDC